MDGLNESIKTLVERYLEDERRVTYLEVVHFAQAEGEALRERNKTRSVGRMNQASSITVPDRKIRERHRSEITMESSAENQEIYELSQKAGKHAMISCEGTSVPNSYFPTGSASFSE